MPRQQEETPLLLLFLEDSSTAQRRPLFSHNRNNYRYNRINEGASTVLTQWPSQISTCCMAACIFLIFFLTFLIIMLGATFNPNVRYPYCLGNKYMDNSTRIYLVHHGKWHQNQFQAIEDIVKKYPEVPIELIDLWNSTLASHRSIARTKNAHKKEVIKRKQNIDKNKEVFIQIDMDWPFAFTKSKETSAKTDDTTVKFKNLKHLLKMYPAIIHEEQTISNFFSLTPLYDVWKVFDVEIIEFAARVLKLWEYGGISFKLPEDLAGGKQVQYKQWRMDTLNGSNITTFMNLTEGMVNIDNEVFRMETKTPCHAFFGELLANLRKCTSTTYVDDIVSASLKTFCENGDVSELFCSQYFMIE